MCVCFGSESEELIGCMACSGWMSKEKHKQAMDRIEEKLYAPIEEKLYAPNRLFRTKSSTPVATPPLSPALGWQGDSSTGNGGEPAIVCLDEERKREAERAVLRERAALRSIERREQKRGGKAQDQAAGSSHSASIGTPRTAARHAGGGGGGGGGDSLSPFEASPYPTMLSPHLSAVSGIYCLLELNMRFLVYIVYWN